MLAYGLQFVEERSPVERTILDLQKYATVLRRALEKAIEDPKVERRPLVPRVLAAVPENSVKNSTKTA